MFDRREFMKKLNEELKKAQDTAPDPPEPIFYYAACNQCASCLFVCEVIRFEDVDEARAEMSRAIRYSLGESDEKPSYIINNCTLCGECNEYCGRMAEPVVLFKKIQSMK